MRILLILLLAIPTTICASPRVPQATQTTQPQSQQRITIPPVAGATIPQDAMYALGQQSGKIDDMSKRIDEIQTDVKNIGADVQKLDVYASIFGAILLVIVAPLVFEGIRRWLFKPSHPASA